MSYIERELLLIGIDGVYFIVVRTSQRRGLFRKRLLNW